MGTIVQAGGCHQTEQEEHVRAAGQQVVEAFAALTGAASKRCRTEARSSASVFEEVVGSAAALFESLITKSEVARFEARH